MRVTCVLVISGILLTGADAVRSVKQLQPAIERNDYGKGSKTEVLDVKVGDTKKKIRTDIEVSERRYTTEEIQELFGRIIRRMDRLILNENPDAGSCGDRPEPDHRDSGRTGDGLLGTGQV